MRRNSEIKISDGLVRNEYLFLLTLFLLACFLGILYAFYLKGNLPIDDAKGFDILGLNILRYGQYAFEPGVPTALKTPLYPLFLSAIYSVFGHSYLAVRIIQSIIGSLSCVVVYFIGKKISDKNLGYVSAIICVFYPFFIYYTGYLLVETLFTFLLAVTIYCLIIAMEKPIGMNFGLSGVLMGLSGLCKPTAFVFFPFAILGFLINLGTRKFSTYKNLAVFFFLFVLTLSPWIIRNYVVFHRIIPGATQLGATLLDGSLLFAAQHERRMDEERQTNPVLLKGEELNEVKRNDYFTREAILFMRNNPRYMVNLALRKFLKFWRLYPHTADIYQYEYSTTLLVLISLFSYGLIVPFSIAGIVISFSKWRRFVFFYGVILSFTFLHMIFWSQIRYRLPIMPYMIIFAVISLNSILQKMKIAERMERSKIRV